MQSKRISKLWIAWAFVVGGLAAAWLAFSPGRLGYCLRESKFGVEVCLGGGVFNITSGISSSIPLPRFEIDELTPEAWEQQTASGIPLTIPLIVLLVGIPAIRGLFYLRELRKRMLESRPYCRRCGYNMKAIDSSLCPKCEYSHLLLSPSSTNLAVGLPCPKCFYDLRGLLDGQCPECGSSFSAAQLLPEHPGLVLETWRELATSRLRRALLPWRIVFSPLMAFRHRSRFEMLLSVRPTNTILWSILWCAMITILLSTIHVIQKSQPVEQKYFYGYLSWMYWARLGSVTFLPIHLVIVWLECLIVSCVGMTVSGRLLRTAQIAYLTSWLSVFVLLIGLFDRILGSFLGRLIISLLDQPKSEWTAQLVSVAGVADERSFEIILGLVAGLAVGTLFQSRRLIIALASAAVLAAANPVMMEFRDLFTRSILAPLGLTNNGGCI